MGIDDDLLAFIDLIYEAAVNSARWPAALIRLADITKTAHVALASMDCRAQTFELDCSAHRSGHAREVQELLGLS